ncbi:MAG: hypothetical protein GXY47_02020 [Acidobacteria bacterium]|nr:hypothetical protein [Acidobacteriota bacterium]
MMGALLFLLLPFLFMQPNGGSCCEYQRNLEKTSAMIFFSAEDMRTHVEYFEPLYPPGLDRKLNISGVIEMEVRYDPQGKAECIRILSGNPIGVSAMMESIDRWRFKPAKINGIPTWCCGRIVVEYRFHKGSAASRLK